MRTQFRQTESLFLGRLLLLLELLILRLFLELLVLLC